MDDQAASLAKPTASWEWTLAEVRGSPKLDVMVQYCRLLRGHISELTPQFIRQELDWIE